MTDRELLLAWEEGKKAEQQAMDQGHQYQAQAAGLATFCQVFLETLLAPAPGTILVSRDEALRLLVAAIQGR
jgi:hypothetical protein